MSGPERPGTYRLFSGNTEIGTVTYTPDGHATIAFPDGTTHRIEPRRSCPNSLMAALVRSNRKRK